jgi:hypothetical protein
MGNVLMDGRTGPKMIGGFFGLEEILSSDNCYPPFLMGKNIFLVNARSGILLLIKLLSPPNVWLPSYLCASIVETVEKSETRVRFYGVTYSLEVPSRTWLDDVQQGDLVVLVDYFGFPCDYSCARQAKEQGAWVLEDACQALLSKEVGNYSDFVLFSPRKFLGVPDGGILTLRRESDFPHLDLQSPPAEWWLSALLATVLRREFDSYGGSRRWFELFQKVEAEAPIGKYTMSELSKMLLMNAFDYSAIARRRIDNYEILADKMSDLALFPDLSSNTVPLGFPIHVEGRDNLRRVLFDHKIYPPVHWPIQGIVPEEFEDSHKLASEIMTLPCDQRYDSSDMYRITELVSVQRSIDKIERR